MDDAVQKNNSNDTLVCS